MYMHITWCLQMPVTFHPNLPTTSKELFKLTWQILSNPALRPSSNWHNLMTLHLQHTSNAKTNPQIPPTNCSLRSVRRKKAAPNAHPAQCVEHRQNLFHRLAPGCSRLPVRYHYGGWRANMWPVKSFCGRYLSSKQYEPYDWWQSFFFQPNSWAGHSYTCAALVQNEINSPSSKEGTEWQFLNYIHPNLFFKWVLNLRVCLVPVA